MHNVSGKVDEKATQLHAIASLKVINSEIYINNEIILIEFLAELFCIGQTRAQHPYSSLTSINQDSLQLQTQPIERCNIISHHIFWIEEEVLRKS